MKILLSCSLLLCTLAFAKAGYLDPSDVLKQDGVLRISDGSSYYEFSTNGTFKVFPVGASGRCFTGTCTSSADTRLLHFTATAKMWWLNGAQPPPDNWRIVFAIYPGDRRPAERFHLATFDCYWIIEELRKIPKEEK